MMARKSTSRRHCVYRGCGLSREDSIGHGPIFRFPSDDDRRVKWIHLSGNLELLELSKKTVVQNWLCSRHFSPDSYNNSDCDTLKWNALPIPYQSETMNARGVTGRAEHMDVEDNTQAEVVNAVMESQQEVIQEGGIPEEIAPRPHGVADSTGGMDVEDKAQHEVQREITEEIVPRSRCAQKRKVENDNDDIEELKRKMARLEANNSTLRGELFSWQTKMIQKDDKIRKLRYKLQQQAKQHEKKLNNMTIEEFLERVEPQLEPVAETMVKLQFRKGSRMPYNDDERDLAKQLWYYSASSYSRLRAAGCNLPAESTVRGWISAYDIGPGFRQVIFDELREKMKTLSPSERRCAMAFDEMALKDYEEYSKKYDLVEGLEDLGPLGRTDQRAKYVFVFYLTSLDVENKWRQPVAYFLPSAGGMSAENMASLIETCLRYLKDAGVDVRLLVCDQGPNNQKLFQKIFQLNASEPTIELDGKKYSVAFDFPHLIKRLVAMLRNHINIWSGGKVIASWSDFVDAYTYDSSLKTSNLLSHISEIHLNPNSFQSMKVQRAFQILSHKYAQAIRLYGTSLERESAALQQAIPSGTWPQTADFAEKMNDIIDACNSGTLVAANPQRRPLHKDNPQIEMLITDLVQWSSTWAAGMMNGSFTPPCLWGLRLTGNALLGVYNDVCEEDPDFKFCTARGNQDGVEHYFSQLRSHNGNCLNPTARMIRLTVRHQLSLKFPIKISNRGNVSCEDDKYLTDTPPSKVSTAFNNISESLNTVVPIGDSEDINNTAEMNSMLDEIQEHDNLNVNEQFDTSECTLYEDNAITFFAGYVAFKTIKMTKCERCHSDMTKSPMEAGCSSEIYIGFREYENVDIDAPKVTKLTRPTEKFSRVIGIQLHAFDCVWKKHWSSVGVRKKIVEDIRNILKKRIPDWLDPTHCCFEHRMEALMFLTLVKIFSRSKFNNRAAAKSKLPLCSRKQKIKNVTHQ